MNFGTLEKIKNFLKSFEVESLLCLRLDKYRETTEKFKLLNAEGYTEHKSNIYITWNKLDFIF